MYPQGCAGAMNDIAVNTLLIDGMVTLETRVTVLLDVDCLLGITESFGLIVADPGQLAA